MALACACTGNRTDSQSDADSLGVGSGQTIVLDSITCHRHKNLIEGQDAPSYDITLALLAAQGDDEASRTFNEQLCLALYDKQSITLDSAMHFLADSLATSYAADLKEMFEPGADDAFTFQYTYEVKASVDSASHPGVAAYTTDLYAYLGGAHGSREVTCANLSLLTGKTIHAADFFQEDKQAEVKQLVEQSLTKQYGCANMDQLAEKTSIGALGEVSVRDNNFLLLRDSVEFVYNPYEIAPWACGLITTRVAYSALAPYTHQDILSRK